MYLSKFPTLEEISEKESFKPGSDAIWEKLVLEKFDIVSRLKYKNASFKLKPYDVIKYYEDTKMEYLMLTKPHVLEKTMTIQEHFNNNYKHDNEEEKYYKNYNWRQVFFKLYLRNVY